MKYLYSIIICLLLVSCNYEYKEVKYEVVVVNKTYTPITHTTMAVPYQIGKFSGIRMQPITHPERFEFDVQYSNGHIETSSVTEEVFNTTNIGDTVYINKIIRVN